MKFEFPFGPRVIFKRDAESSIGRGAVILAWHFHPYVADMYRAACASAPFATEEVWVTEGHRDIRRTRDLHKEFKALDFTARDASGDRLSEDEYELMAQRMRLFLGPDYDIVVHGEGDNLHIHVEHDPK